MIVIRLVVLSASLACVVLNEGRLVKSANSAAIVNSSKVEQLFYLNLKLLILLVVTNKGTFNIVTETSPNNASRAYLGVSTVSHN